MNTQQYDSKAWAEYDSAAEWMVVHGLTGASGDRLPPGLSARARLLIYEDPEAFEERVRGTAYAFAMAKHESET